MKKKWGRKTNLRSEGQEKSKALCLYILKSSTWSHFDASADFYEQFNKKTGGSKTCKKCF